MPVRRSIKILGVAAIALGVAWPILAAAQQLPGPAEPGQILKQLQPVPQPQSEEAPVVAPSLEPGKPPSNADDIRFVLNDVVIDGASVFVPDVFSALYEKILGTEVTLREVFAIAEAITARYRRDGYLLSLAVVPAQKITAGVVQIKVIEGYVDRVFIDGDLGSRGAFVRDLAERITQARPLKAQTLERYVLLINDLPGLKVRALLKPSSVSGAADLVLSVEEKDFDGYASIDNRGSRYVGPIQETVGVTMNSVLGYNERTSVRALMTGQVNELKFVEVSHGVPLTTDGTRGRIIASMSSANPGYTLKESDVHSESTSLAVEASHPFIRSRAENLSVNARFGMRTIEADQAAGSSRISKDIIRAVRLRADYDFVDTLVGPAVNLVSIEASQGLDILGARESGSPNLSRAAGRSDFTKLTLNTQRLQALGGGFSLLAAANGQFSFSPLLAAEEFGFGGAQFGRGYDAAELIGDHGLAAKFELSYGAELDQPAFKSYQVYTFYDIGAVWNIDRAAGEAARNSAASTGLGARANLTAQLSANVELGIPLTGRVAARGQNGEDPRLFFSIIGRF